jgi:membrane protease YdiL (CAAX protease family)
LVAFYTVLFIPKLLNVTISQTTHLCLILTIQTSILLICLRLIYKEYHFLNLTSLFERLRFKKITKKDFYVSIGIWLLSGVLGSIIKLFLEFLQISFNINEQFEIAKANNVVENGSLLVLSVLVISIIGPIQEEVLFRGYLLPKQEKVLGKFAWVFNGFAFLLAHLMVYDVFSLLVLSPFCFLIAYKVQKYKNTSIGLMAHMFLNLGFVIRLFIDV